MNESNDNDNNGSSSSGSSTTMLKAAIAFFRSKARVLVGAGLVLTFALIARMATAQPHTDPAHPAVDPSTGHVAADPPDPKGHDTVHPEGGHDPLHHGPDPINWTDISDKRRPAFIALLVNFGLLAALYFYLGKKPITEGLKQRRINIGKDIEEARKMLDEAKERAKKYQADLKNADTDAATAKASLISAGKGEVERLLIETEERAERMKRDAERLVEQERKQLQQDLLIETVNLAVEQAHKLLERGSTPEDHARLATELLAELARKPAAPRVSGSGGSVAPPRSTV
jgi:F0F1-type ATP synthase membrane subunit b/b'